MDFQGSLPIFNNSSNLSQCFQLQQLPISLPTPAIAHNCDIPSDNTLFMDFYYSLANLMEDETQIIERHLHLQSEQIQVALQQQLKQNTVTLMRRLEATTAILMRQKDEELMVANMRGIELMEFIRREEEEAKMWQMIAKENEAKATALNHTLQKVSGPCLSSTQRVIREETASSSSFSSGGLETLQRKRPGFTRCKSCGIGRSRMLIFPCRHLCLCKSCVAFIQSCPQCASTKEDCIEVFLH